MYGIVRRRLTVAIMVMGVGVYIIDSEGWSQIKKEGAFGAVLHVHKKGDGILFGVLNEMQP